MIRLLFENISDGLIRDLFKKIMDYLNSLDILKSDFRFFEYTFNSAVTNFELPHNLKKLPKDLIQTSVTGGITVTWNYDSFSNTHLSVTTSGPGTVRYYLGTFTGGLNV
jgi:hypothetical protein